jgi:hypothetical protein
MKKYVLASLLIGLGYLSYSQTCQTGKNVLLHLKSNEPSSSTLASNQRSDTVNVLKYTINLNITDFTNKIISGHTLVKFTPKLNGVNKLYLDLLELIVDSVQIGNTNLSFSYNDTLLGVHLGTTYNMNDTVDIKVFYHGTPQMDATGWGGFYFQNGFAYNLGVGFGADPHVYGRVWFPCFDNFVERSKYEFNIVTNGGKIAYCNGYLTHDTTDVSGNRTRKWLMNEEIPTYLAMVAVANYTQVNQVYNGLNSPISIVLAALASDTTIVKNSFVNLNTALSSFENNFGPYEWNKVGYCMVPFNAGAMEHATSISYPKPFATGSTADQNLMAHELAHHWFGNLATCRTQEDMWLNEGWASYCEYIFTEALSGYASYLSGIRVNHESLLQFLHVNEGYLSLSNIPHQYTYGDHVYSKGADIAHTMRGYMGDSLFFYSVKTYLSQNHYKDVSSLDFQNALTAASGINMSDFFNDWVNNPGWSHFSIDSFLVSPNGANYDVTVFVKQKLTGAPNYHVNVPLELTFKSANWIENTKKINMSGANSTFTFTIPFNPIFVAVNMGEKISHAVAPEIKKIKTTGTHNFPNAKMSLNVSSISDSAFVRIEHNYTKPDTFKTVSLQYRLSPNRYHKIDGILPSNFKAKATFSYDGRTSASSGGNFWLDNYLFTTGVTEDSLVLMYRKNAAADWSVYPYYTKNTLGSTTDKRGSIIIDSVQLGEYVLAVHDYVSGIQNETMLNEIKKINVFPNPANDNISIDLSDLNTSSDVNCNLIITDITGKIIYTSSIQSNKNKMQVTTSKYSNGMYFIMITDSKKIIAKNKFIVSH